MHFGLDAQGLGAVERPECLTASIIHESGTTSGIPFVVNGAKETAKPEATCRLDNPRLKQNE